MPAQKKSKNRELSACSDKALIQELKKRIQKGGIDFEYDIYDREIGLRCVDYQWNFPDVWNKKFWKFKKEIKKLLNKAVYSGLELAEAAKITKISKNNNIMPKPKPSGNGLANPLLRKGTPTSLPPPKKVKCFQCQTNFFIKYVIPHKDYSKKNNWEYWTNPQAISPEFWKNKEVRQKDKQICDSCLRKFYYDKEVYWETITDLRIRSKLRTYICSGLISV